MDRRYPRRVLSTPSLGITCRERRGHRRPHLRLSTPSLGITRGAAGGIWVGSPAFNSLSRDHEHEKQFHIDLFRHELFQLPLSGSLAISTAALTSALYRSFFQLPLSGSHGLRVLICFYWRRIQQTFNSLSRDHGPCGASDAEGEGTGASFQLPLSGSQMKLERGLVWGYDPGFQLPLSGSPGSPSSRSLRRLFRAFNSLSRDHRSRGSSDATCPRSILSTPSLGITDIKLVSHILCHLSLIFQLPLSGSLRR